MMSAPRLATTARTSPDPVRHATWGKRRTPHGKTLRALCGAGAYLAPHVGYRFDPGHPRACPRCVEAMP